MTAVRLRQALVLLGCSFGGAVSASLLLCIGALTYFDNILELSTFLDTANPVIGVCGAVFGIAVFALTRGRGHLQGLGSAVQQTVQADAAVPRDST